MDYDLVIVDEAHRLKRRGTAAWQLVNDLKKRFLFLLSATPVGNDLTELYNLILLLRPGLLSTEARFRRDYGRLDTLRDPARREKLRTLLREVMVRNTRAHIDLRLPRRLAATIVVQPGNEETICLGAVSAWIRERYAAGGALDRQALMTLQMQAASSGAAKLWINPDARSVAEWPGLLETATPRDYLLVSDLGPHLQTASMLAGRVAGVMARHDLNDLLESLDRRRARDVRRLREYFDGIYQEIGRKAKRATRPESRASEMRRLDATRDAYLARVADVIERYRVQVRVWPVMVVGCLISAYQLRVELLRRRTKSDVTFSWNALDRTIEARCCDGCARPIRAADLCDDRAHWPALPVWHRVWNVAGRTAAPVTNGARGHTGSAGLCLMSEKRRSQSLPR